MFCFDNHLSRQLPTRFNSVLSPCLPYQIWVSRLWGLPRSTLLFLINYVTVALSGIRPWFPLGILPPLRTPTYLALFFPLAQSLRASQLVRAWTFLWHKPAIIRIECYLILYGLNPFCHKNLS